MQYKHACTTYLIHFPCMYVVRAGQATEWKPSLHFQPSDAAGVRCRGKVHFRKCGGEMCRWKTRRCRAVASIVSGEAIDTRKRSIYCAPVRRNVVSALTSFGRCGMNLNAPHFHCFSAHGKSAAVALDSNECTMQIAELNAYSYRESYSGGVVRIKDVQIYDVALIQSVIR